MCVVSLPLPVDIQEDSVGFWIIWWIWLSCDSSTLRNSRAYRHWQGKHSHLMTSQPVLCLKPEFDIPYDFSCFWAVVNDFFFRLVWFQTDHCQHHSLQMKMASAAALGIRQLLATWMLLSCLQDHDQALHSTFWILWVVQISMVFPRSCLWASIIHFISIDFCFSFIASEMEVLFLVEVMVVLNRSLLQQFWMEAVRKPANCFLLSIILCISTTEYIWLLGYLALWVCTGPSHPC